MKKPRRTRTEAHHDNRNFILIDKIYNKKCKKCGNRFKTTKLIREYCDVCKK